MLNLANRQSFAAPRRDSLMTLYFVNNNFSVNKDLGWGHNHFLFSHWVSEYSAVRQKPVKRRRVSEARPKRRQAVFLTGLWTSLLSESAV